MSRFAAAVLCAVGLTALPAAAQSLQLDPPTLSARAERCNAAVRARCEGVGQRTIESDLACDACTPMPAELTEPEAAPAAAPTRSPACLPRASGQVPRACTDDVPRLDHIPRP